VNVEESVGQILHRHQGRAGALLPILNDLQAALGHVPAAAVPLIAEALNLSRAEVHGVVTFYHDYRAAPADRPVIRLCRAEACQARGVEALAPILEGDERIHVETVYCLGLCAIGPAVMVEDQVYVIRDADEARRLADTVAA
jgi:formate dehydrogenase subunit gamma